MIKKTYKKISLECVLTQQPGSDAYLEGLLSQAGKGKMLFQQTVRRKQSQPRNPKLFDGRYLSLVRMRNGRYQCHLKTFCVEGSEDRQQLALQITQEISSALELIR